VSTVACPLTATLADIHAALTYKHAVFTHVCCHYDPALLVCVQEYLNVFQPPTALKELQMLFIYLHSQLWSKALHKDYKPVGARRDTHRTRDLQGLCLCVNRCVTVCGCSNSLIYMYRRRAAHISSLSLHNHQLRVSRCTRCTCDRAKNISVDVQQRSGLCICCTCGLHETARIAARRKLFIYDINNSIKVITLKVIC
jgi:hypothetical protein